MAAPYTPGYDALAGVVILATAFLAIIQFGETRLTTLVNDKRAWALTDAVAKAAEEDRLGEKELWDRLVNYRPHESRALLAFLLGVLFCCAVLYATAALGEFHSRTRWLIDFVLSAGIPFLAALFPSGLLWFAEDMYQLFRGRTEFARLVQDFETLSGLRS